MGEIGTSSSSYSSDGTERGENIELASSGSQSNFNMDKGINSRCLFVSRTLAGSTIMLLTIAWAGSLLIGRCELDHKGESIDGTGKGRMGCCDQVSQSIFTLIFTKLTGYTVYKSFMLKKCIVTPLSLIDAPSCINFKRFFTINFTSRRLTSTITIETPLRTRKWPVSHSPNSPTIKNLKIPW